MSHKFRKLLNNFHAETELRNCLPEIKDVAKAEANSSKQRTEAVREINKWGKNQDDAIGAFLARMGEFEEQLNMASAQFNDGYNHYYLAWKEILKDRTELKDTIGLHKKAKSKVEKAIEKAESARKAHRKAPTDKTQDAVKAAEAAVPEAEAEEARVAQQVQDKLLEVQKEMHEQIRSGYYSLHDSRMAFYKESANIAEKALESLGAFVAVKGATADGFEYAPFAAEPGPNMHPIWHKGDELYKKLQEQLELAKQGMDAQMGKLRADMEAEIKRLNALLLQQQQEHEALLRSSKNSSQMQLQRELLQVVLALGSQNVSDAVEGVEKDIIDFLGLKSREAHAASMALSESPVQNISILARTVFGTIFSAVGAVHTLDPVQGKQLFNLATEAAQTAKTLFDAMTVRAGEDPTGDTLVAHGAAEPLQNVLARIIDFATKAAIQTGAPPVVAKGITAAQAAIREVLETIERLKDQSQKTDKERVLEVNQGLLTAGAAMFEAAKEVIDSATAMQDNLGLDEGKQVAESEHKLRIRKWSAALTTTIDAIVENSPVWMECLRQVVKGAGKHEEMQVSSRSISACSAQLVAFVRSTLSAQGGSSTIEKSTEQLQTNAHVVIAFIKDANQLQLANVVLDQYSQLSENQAKKLVMVTQVEVLRLESALTKEREKLSQLRRLNYNK